MSTETNGLSDAKANIQHPPAQNFVIRKANKRLLLTRCLLAMKIVRLVRERQEAREETFRERKAHNAELRNSKEEAAATLARKLLEAETKRKEDVAALDGRVVAALDGRVVPQTFVGRGHFVLPV